MKNFLLVALKMLVMAVEYAEQIPEQQLKTLVVFTEGLGC